MVPFRKGTWRWRGMVALTAVALGFAIYPITEPGSDVINSDWPAFATGAKIAMTNPTHLYDIDVQRRVQVEVTGGRQLVTPGIQGKPSLSAGLLQKGFSIPAMFNRHLRKQQAAPGIQGHQQSVAANLHLFRTNGQQE